MAWNKATRGVAAGFDSWRQPQSDRGEITESPDTALTEGDPAEGLQRLGKTAQVLAGFGVDPADERVRRERKNKSPDGTLALDLTHTRELHTHVVPLSGSARAVLDAGGCPPGHNAGHGSSSVRRCRHLWPAITGPTLPGLRRARPRLSRLRPPRLSPGPMRFEGLRVTGICDWLTACRRPHGIDLARMRPNLAEGWSVEMAEEFRTSYRALFGEERVDPYWDLLDAADVLLDLPDRSPAQVLPGHGRFEEWVRQAVVELG